MDTAVGWCVLPLADSRLRVIRGSYRIPMLRGEPNPNIGLHQGLEMLIAEDLESWLGNLYLDTRHLTRGARDGVGADGQGFGGGGDGYDVEYDHIRKVSSTTRMRGYKIAVHAAYGNEKRKMLILHGSGRSPSMTQKLPCWRLCEVVVHQGF